EVRVRFASAVVILGVVWAAAAAPQPRVEIAVDDASALLVGQQFRVHVTVLVPNFFLGAPHFPTLDSPDAVIRLLDERANNTTETIDGESYSGIEKTYSVTPLRAGELALPAGSIAVTYAAVPGQPGVTAEIALPRRTFDVSTPKGGDDVGSPIVGSLEVTQTFDRDPTGIKVGDALTRTITTSAPDTQAMLIPPPTFDAPVGVRVYGHDPVLSDVTSERDEFLGGRRTDSATYAFDKPGEVTLPAI